MAIQLIGHIAWNADGTSSHSLAGPWDTTGGGIGGPLAENDVLILQGGADAQALSNPTGWTQLASDGDPMDLQVAWRRMGASPDTTVSGLEESDGVAYVVTAFRGVDPTTAFDAAMTSATGASGMPNSPAISTVTDGAWVLSLGFLDDDNASEATGPSGYTLIAKRVQNVGVATVMIAYREKATAGAEDPGPWSSADSDEWTAYAIALRPAAATGPQDVAPSFANLSTFGAGRLDQSLAPAAVGGAVAFGGVSTGYAVRPAAYVDPAAFGGPTLEHKLLPTGAAGAQAFGTASLELSVAAAAHANASALGSMQPKLGLAPAGLAGLAALGEPALAAAGLTITPAGLSAGGQPGTPRLDQALAGAGHAGAVAFGTLALRLTVSAAGPGTTAAFGWPTLATAQALGLAGLTGPTAFGTIALRRLWDLAPLSAQAWSGDGPGPAGWLAIAPLAPPWAAEASAQQTWAPAPPEPESWT